MNKFNEVSHEVMISYYVSFPWFIMCLSILLEGQLKFKGVHFEGFMLYALMSWFLTIFFYTLYKDMRYLIDNSSLSGNIILKTFLKSKFFIMFIIVFLYQNFSFSYFNFYILLALYIPFFVFQKELWDNLIELGKNRE